MRALHEPSPNPPTPRETSIPIYFPFIVLLCIPFSAANVLEFCSDHLSIEDVWSLKSFEVSQTLRDILEIVDAWIQVCDSLTRLFWPNYGQHPWLGEPHIPKNAILFQERLNEIKNIKNMYKDITCLFNENNQIDKSIRRIFIPFRGKAYRLRIPAIYYIVICIGGMIVCVCVRFPSALKRQGLVLLINGKYFIIEINIFDITPVGTKKWKRALLQYERVLEPINEKISLVLKSKLHNHLNDPREVNGNTIILFLQAVHMFDAVRNATQPVSRTQHPPGRQI